MSQLQRLHDLAGPMRAIAQRHGLVILGVFGSVARGEERSDSDVDVLVDARGVGLFALLGCRVDLEQLLGVAVDVVPVGGLKPGVRDNVMADLLPL